MLCWPILEEEKSLLMVDKTMKTGPSSGKVKRLKPTHSFNILSQKILVLTSQNTQSDPPIPVKNTFFSAHKINKRTKMDFLDNRPAGPHKLPQQTVGWVCVQLEQRATTAEKQRALPMKQPNINNRMKNFKSWREKSRQHLAGTLSHSSVRSKKKHRNSKQVDKVKNFRCVFFYKMKNYISTNLTADKGWYIYSTKWQE